MKSLAALKERERSTWQVYVAVLLELGDAHAMGHDVTEHLASMHRARENWHKARRELAIAEGRMP